LSSADSTAHLHLQVTIVAALTVSRGHEPVNYRGRQYDHFLIGQPAHIAISEAWRKAGTRVNQYF
jgi:hypothetical protein